LTDTTSDPGTSASETAGPLHIGAHAGRVPDKPATVDAATRRIRTFAELEDRSARLARLLGEAGVPDGGGIAALLGNQLEYFDAAWATQRSGRYLTPVNWHLTAEEAAYIIADCEAQALITTPSLISVAELGKGDLRPPALGLVAGSDQEAPAGWTSLETALAKSSPEPLRPEMEGTLMFYSSGTTGKPKGIRRAAAPEPYGTARMIENMMAAVYGFDAETVYLCPAPLYHAAPLAWSMGTQRLGGTVVVMNRFDPLEFLRLIEQYRITHTQMVPTMFVRLLKLDEADRRGYDLSSLKMVIHAAAPCPVEVKAQMLDWWGPIIYEYYSSSEGAGFTAIGPNEWRAHPGSVGKPRIGTLHIVGEDGTEMHVGQVGTVYCEGGGRFEYHNDPGQDGPSVQRPGLDNCGRPRSH
jgi:acyl-CoA synthetase (AMP-forming)/AMP-acid ligase II